MLFFMQVYKFFGVHSRVFICIVLYFVITMNIVQHKVGHCFRLKYSKNILRINNQFYGKELDLMIFVKLVTIGFHKHICISIYMII